MECASSFNRSDVSLLIAKARGYEIKTALIQRVVNYQMVNQWLKRVHEELEAWLSRGRASPR
jgi:hypothetical protein